jgi:hypothetical protein
MQTPRESIDEQGGVLSPPPLLPSLPFSVKYCHKLPAAKASALTHSAPMPPAQYKAEKEAEQQRRPKAR